MEPAVAFTRAFKDIQKDLRGYLTAVEPGKYDAALTVRFARIQAQLADDLRQSLDLPPFDRERVVMVTLQAFRDALKTAGIVDDATSMRLAQDAVARVGLRVQAQTHDEVFAAEREDAMATLVEQGVATWTWKATLDVHTCLFCIARHGQTFPTTLAMESHPNCRCRPVAGETTVASGDRFLSNLSRANRRRIMGKVRAAMYESGDYTLNDLVDLPKRRVIPVKEFFRKVTPYAPSIRRLAKLAVNGFTAQPRTGNVPTGGYMVAGLTPADDVLHVPFRVGDPPDTVALQIARFVEDNWDKLGDPNVYLGGWRYKSKVFVELSQHVDEEAMAKRIARDRHELAIFDLEHMVEIKVEGEPEQEVGRSVDADLLAARPSMQSLPGDLTSAAYKELSKKTPPGVIVGMQPADVERYIVKTVAAKKRLSVYDAFAAEEELVRMWGMMGVGDQPYPKKWLRVGTTGRLPPDWEVDVSHTQMAHRKDVAKEVRGIIPKVFHFMAKLGLRSNWNGLVEVGAANPDFGPNPPLGMKNWTSSIWFRSSAFAGTPDVPDTMLYREHETKRHYVVLHLVTHEFAHSFSSHDTDDPDAYGRYSWLEEGPVELLSRTWMPQLAEDQDDATGAMLWIADQESHAYTQSVRALHSIARAIEYPYDIDGPMDSPGAQMCFDMLQVPISKRPEWLRRKVDRYRRKHHGHFHDASKATIDGHLAFLTRERDPNRETEVLPAMVETRTPPGFAALSDKAVKHIDGWMRKHEVDMDGLVDHLLRAMEDDQARREGAVWYRDEFQKQAAKLAAEYGVSQEVASAVIAITSAQTRWTQGDRYRNLEIADAYLAAWKRGDFEGAHTLQERIDAQQNLGYYTGNGFGANVVGLLNGDLTLDEAITGAKRRSFFNNGMDPDGSEDVTNDSWMGQFLVAHSDLTLDNIAKMLSNGIPDYLFAEGVAATPAYIVLAEAVVRATARAKAAKLVPATWTNAMTQATCWSWIRGGFR